MNTLVFCTSWAGGQAHWQWRYEKWLRHIRGSALGYAQILVVDDGSTLLPNFGPMSILAAEQLPPSRPSGDLVFARFSRHLGRRAVFDYPGWWRSFMFAAGYATRCRFDKIVHVESDTFVLSTRLQEYINSLERGWLAFWCPRWRRPETCLQVICADQLPSFRAVAEQAYDPLIGSPVEELLPFTEVRTEFKGDRYGEYSTDLPRDADYAAQVLLGTPVWSGRPPSKRRVAALTIGSSWLPAEPALYPGDAWDVAATAAASSMADVGDQILGWVDAGLDAVEITVDECVDAQSLSASWGNLRRSLVDGGELAVQLRGHDHAGKAAQIAQAIGPSGFSVVAGVDNWIIARADRDTAAAVLVEEQLRARLRAVSSRRP
jgi:hypothetical protein